MAAWRQRGVIGGSTTAGSAVAAPRRDARRQRGGGGGGGGSGSGSGILPAARRRRGPATRQQQIAAAGKTGGPVLPARKNADSHLAGALLQLGVPPSNHINLIVIGQVDKRDGGRRHCIEEWMELQAYSDAQRSSVEPHNYSTYRELQLRIFYYSYAKKHKVVGNLLGACLQPALKSESGRFSIVTGLVVACNYCHTFHIPA